MRELTFIRSSGRIGVAGFTLVELLVAVMLISVMMFVAVPRLMGLKKSPMVRALDAIEEACNEARSRAILGNRPMQVVIYGAAGEILVEPAPEGVMGATNGVSIASFEAMHQRDTLERSGKPPFHAVLDSEVAFRKLTVNAQNMMFSELAAIRFFSNGTCDSMAGELTHLRSGGEIKRLILEVITARLSIEGIR